MFSEKMFEDILVKYPELIEKGLVLKARQETLYNRRIDLLFEDQQKRKLLVELKAHTIKDKDIGQIMAYEGLILTENPTLRVMLIGTRVPPNLQKSLDYHGIAWKEISVSTIQKFLDKKNDTSFLEEIKKTQQQKKAEKKRAKTKTFGSIVIATKHNVTHTPIYELIKQRVTERTIRDWSKIDRLIPDKHTPPRELNSVDLDFYNFVKNLSKEISQDVRFDKSLAVKTVNKYETCVLSGIRKHQQKLGIRQNLNHVKYNTIRRLLKKNE